MKISLFDINQINSVIGENKLKNIMWLMNRRPYKTIHNVDIAGQPPKNISLIAYKLSIFYIHTT